MEEGAQPLEDLVKKLSPLLQQEVRDFVEFLLERKEAGSQITPRLSRCFERLSRPVDISRTSEKGIRVARRLSNVAGGY